MHFECARTKQKKKPRRRRRRQWHRALHVKRECSSGLATSKAILIYTYWLAAHTFCENDENRGRGGGREWKKTSVRKMVGDLLVDLSPLSSFRLLSRQLSTSVKCQPFIVPCDRSVQCVYFAHFFLHFHFKLREREREWEIRNRSSHGRQFY